MFQKSFAVTESVELCRLYVDYVRSISDFVTGGDKARATVIQAFEFAVGKVGIDIQSDSLWQDYISFIKSWTPTANWEQQQKIDLIRKVYKKLLTIPTENIETNWTQYTKWENELNPVTAQKFVSEKSADFMLARSWNTEWLRITNKKLKRTITPHSVADETIDQQMKYWHNWIEMEKKNSLELKDESAIQSRISYVYKQATFALPFVSQIWFESVKYLLTINEESNISMCIHLLKNGLSLNPKSLLLSFQLAELYEKDNSFDKAKVIFNNLIQKYIKEFEGIATEYDAIQERLKPKVENETGATEDSDDEMKDVQQEHLMKTTNPISNLSSNSTVTSNGGSLPNIPHLPNIPNLGKQSDVRGANSSPVPSTLPNLPNIPNFTSTNAASGTALSSNEISLADARKLEQLERTKAALVDKITLVYVKFMTASKRAEGIKEARNVFKTARKFGSIGYQIFVESALLEHYADNTKTAIKVFDVGMKTFSTEGEFLAKYLDYLIMINDVDRLRSTIQNADANISKVIALLEDEISGDEKILPVVKKQLEKKLEKKKLQLQGLFKKYISFAATHLSLDVTNSFNKKYEQLFPEDDPINLFSDRYRLGKRNIIKVEELNQEDDIVYEEYPVPNNKRRKLSTSASAISPHETQESISAINSIQESNRIEQEMVEQQRKSKVDNSLAAVGPSIVTLMTVLPNASYFGLSSESVFNSKKLVTLFANSPNIP